MDNSKINDELRSSILRKAALFKIKDEEKNNSKWKELIFIQLKKVAKKNLVLKN